MPTDAEDALADLWEGRAEAGIAGFRLHSVTIVDRAWSGQHTGEGAQYETVAPIVEAGGQPPKVRWLNDEERALGNLGAGTVEVGPITPAFPGGGTSLDLLASVLEIGATRGLLIKGPKHPTGALYRITDLQNERALRYMLRGSPVAVADE